MTSMFSLSAKERQEKATKAVKSLTDKASADAVANSMIQYKLDTDKERKYTTLFFPRNPGSKNPRIDVTHYTNILQGLAPISNGIEQMFAAFRACLQYGRSIDTMTKEDRNLWLDQRFSTLAETTKDQQQQAQIKEFYDSLSSAKTFVIKPSTRYKEGYDVVYSGIDSKTTMRIPSSDYSNIISMVPKGDEHAMQRYVKERNEAYLTEFSRKADAAATLVLKNLFGSDAATSIDDSHKRIQAQLPLSFDFKSLNHVFTSALGITKTHEFIKQNINPNTIATGIDEFFSLLVIRNPEPALINAKMQSQRPALMTGEVLPEVDNKEVVTSEAKLFPNLSFSIVLHLPNDIVRFITQTPETKTVSISQLYNWVRMWTAVAFRRPGSRFSAAAVFNGRPITMGRFPRYTMPASSVKNIANIRKANNYYVEPGRSNDHDLFVSTNGTFNYCPKADDDIASNSLAYEKDMDELVSTFFERDIPIDLNRANLVPDHYFNVIHGPDLSSKLTETRKKLQQHAGKLLTYTWDYDTVLSVSAKDPSQMHTSTLAGATTPTNSAIADYLGFAFGDVAPDTFGKSMSKMLNVEQDEFFRSGPDSITKTSVFESIVKFYTYLAARKQVPGIVELIEQAKKELGLTTLKETTEEGLYYQTMTDDFALRGDKDIHKTGMIMTSMLAAVMFEATGGRGSKLRQSLAVDYPDLDALDEAVRESDRYFEPRSSRMADFGNLYNYFGGKVFLLALKAILALPKSKILSNADYANNDPDKPEDLAHTKYEQYPDFNTLSTELMPVIIMWANYVPDHKRIFEETEKEIETFTVEQTVDADDIHIPGLLAGTQAFPHQVKTQATLRKRPRAAILDIAPGGGKTGMGIMDAAACVKEMKELNVKIRPLILCPDGLIKTWCDDLNKFFGANWNVIPLNSKIFNRWGQERLEELLMNAPPNTLVVTGYNFIKTKTFPIVLGANRVMVSGALEFVKRFGFNYILLDESHKTKNPKSVVHNTAKQLTTASHVKFIRLATGTLISNTLTDIVGQTALISSHVFRTQDEYEAEYQDRGVFKKDTPKLARQKLSRYAAVITMKQKEWAFMLPNPIETFTAVSLADEDTKYSELHQEVYNAVLEETLELLGPKVKAAKANREEEEEDEDDEGGGSGKKGGADDEEGEEDLELDSKIDELAGLEGLLRPYLQRLERILTDPLDDALGREIFAKAGITNFVSRKTRAIVNKIQEHFNVEQWSKSKNYRELDLVEYKDNLYLLRKQNHASLKREVIPNNQQPPDKDTDSWKLEPRGKVLVFCRYTRSANAVYDALPADLKKRARKFTGDEGQEKWANLDDFKMNPAVEILIANEQAITEGHNLQISSRVIRVEMPWAPGDLDQAQARIFRPDPTAAKNMAQNGRPGELYRELIYLDWIVANGTLETAKLGRLIQKIVSKTKFDEAGNQRYSILDDVELKPISMSLDTLRTTFRLEDIDYYTDTYATIKGIQREEFSEMRRSESVRMYDLSVEKPVEGSERIGIVPLLPDQAIADPDNFGLVSGRDFLADKRNNEYVENPKLMIGLPVKVEFGHGTIVNVGQRWTRNEYGEKVIDKENPISSVEVRIGNSDETLSYTVKEIWVATKLTNKNRKLFETDKPWATEAQRKQIAKQLKEDAADDEETAEEIAARKRKDKIKALRDAEKQEEARARGKKREDNQKKGRPVNEDLPEIKKIKVKTKEVDSVLDAADDEANYEIDLNAIVYNGFLTVAVDAADPDYKALSKLGFRYVGPYAYVSVINGKQFNAFLDYVEQKFTLSKATEKRLEEIQNFFDQTKAYRYNSTLSSTAELSNFFRTAHRMVTDRKEIKIYPIVTDDHLLLAVDIETNPGIRRHLGKKIDGIPATTGTWKESPGISMFFAKNKAEAKGVVKMLKDEGYTIDNEHDFLSDLAALQFRKARE